ncbi:type II secretion system F family protein [Paenibacillus senegalensis]|uniref:type II secretion system F family protein n=1 Tax=Paenibacillus senegalensis TaxID=1465766 RepID=UPI000288BBE4|nr:type II secretion system F family protein [Paenibacillus senegalensis]
MAAANHPFKLEKAADEPSKDLAIDYSTYELTWKMRGVSILLASAAMFVLGFIFYKSEWVALLFSAGGWVYPNIRARKLMEKRKDELSSQFRQMLSAVSSSLSAGKSVENAFTEAINDLLLLYPDPQTYMVMELQIINNKIRNGETIERALQDFSRRADLEEVHNFVDVFVTCKRAGGNLIDVIRRTATMIGEKIEMKQEIAVLIAQKKFESTILSFSPLLVIATLSFSSPDYMEPLYNGWIGPLIMTVCLLLLIGCNALSKKIMNIKV